MGNFIIEKGIPVPEKGSTNSELKKLAMAMEEGDSVLMPDRHKASALVTQIRFQEGYTGTMRKQHDGGVRVWKIKKKASSDGS